MLAAFRNILKVKELRTKVFWTFAIIAIVRLVQNVPCPGIDTNELRNMIEEIKRTSGGGVFNMFNMFSGGALQGLAIGVLGIMPYITASIIMQLMTPVVPQLERMQQEGEHGRQQYQNITRWITIAICIVQGWMLAAGMQAGTLPGMNQSFKIVMNPGTGFMLMTVTVMTGGALLIMWLGEQISEKGLGNGASLIITISIISSMPGALGILYDKWRSDEYTIIHIVLLFAVFIGITIGTVALVQGMRKLPIKYARRAVGDQMVQGESTYLPLKVNHAGVMPIIFASALMMFPPLLFAQLKWTGAGKYFAFGTNSYVIIYAAMTLIFTFFWVATQFNPIKIADDLKRSGGFIPGYRPGEPTAKFLNQTMTKITVAGGICLTVLAVIPIMMHSALKTDFTVTQFFGGTSLLIMVGVVLQTMQQIEVQLVQHNYEGFVSSGRLSSRMG